MSTRKLISSSVLCVKGMTSVSVVLLFVLLPTVATSTLGILSTPDIRSNPPAMGVVIPSTLAAQTGVVQDYLDPYPSFWSSCVELNCLVSSCRAPDTGRGVVSCSLEYRRRN